MTREERLKLIHGGLAAFGQIPGAVCVRYTTVPEEHWVECAPGVFNIDWPFAEPPSDFSGWPNLGAIEPLGFQPDKFLAFKTKQTSGQEIAAAVNWFFEQLYELGEEVTLAGQVAARAPEGQAPGQTPPEGGDAAGPQAAQTVTT